MVIYPTAFALINGDNAEFNLRVDHVLRLIAK